MANPRRKITVLDTDIEHEGVSRRTGNPFTIYNVTALGEDGLPIDLRLRTFDGELPRNELIEVEVEKRDDDRHGTTYTISIPGKGSTQPRGNPLAESVDDLKRRVTVLEEALRAISAGEKPRLESLATPPGAGGDPPAF